MQNIVSNKKTHTNGFRARLLASAGLGLLVGLILPSVAFAQIVVNNGETYDGSGAPVTIDTGTASGINAITVTGGTVNLVTHPVDLMTGGTNGRGVSARSGSVVTIGTTGSTNKITTMDQTAYGIYIEQSTATITGMTITTEGSSASGVYGVSNSTINLNDVTVHTKGATAYGIQSFGGSNIIFNGGSVTTERSVSVYVSGTGARASLTDVTATATDNVAVRVQSGGRAVITNSHLTSIGLNALYLAGSDVTVSGSTLIAEKGASGTGSYGIDINDGNTVLRMSDSTIETYANIGHGIWHAANTVTASTVTNSTITTHGDNARGILLQGAGATGSRMVVSGSTIHTYGGSNSYGISIQGNQAGPNAPQLTLSDTTIITEGNSAVGLAAFGRSVVTGTNIRITTSGANAGAVSAAGGSTSLTNFAIETGGNNAIGVRSDNLGTSVSLTDGNILTKGDLAHGILVSAAGQLAVDNVAVETRGANAAGLYMLGANAQSHAVTLNGSSILTQKGPGILVRGASNTLTLNDTSIIAEGGTLFDVRRRMDTVNPAVPDDANPGHLTVVADGGAFKGAARPDALSTLDFSLANGSWVITTAAADGINPGSDLPLNTSQVNVLALNDSTISFAPTGGFKVLKADELRGDGNLFEMNTDLGMNAGDLMQFGTAEGDHRLLIRNSGAEPGAAGQHLRVVGIADPAANATFTLANIGGVVDAGTYRYGLVREDNAAIGGQANDWALLNTSRIDPPPPAPGPGPGPGAGPGPGPGPGAGPGPGPGDLSTTANAAINTADLGTSKSIWYSEMNSLSKRLGELRLGKDQGGLWGRTFASGQKINNKLGRGFNQTNGGIELGLDGSVDVSAGRWYLGGLAGYSRAERDFSAKEGKGHSDSYHVGAYATFIANNGFYFDGVLKLNQLKHDYRINTTDGTRVDGNYSNLAAGMSLEAGWRFNLKDGWFVEPQAEFLLFKAGSAHYRATNGMDVRVGSATSTQLRTGVMVGKLIDLSDGNVIQPYVKLGWIQEFSGNGKVWTNGIAHKGKSEGGRFDLDVGIMAKLGENHRLYADYGYTSGSQVREPWSFNVGYRYAW